MLSPGARSENSQEQARQTHRLDADHGCMKTPELLRIVSTAAAVGVGVVIGVTTLGTAGAAPETGDTATESARAPMMKCEGHEPLDEATAAKVKAAAVAAVPGATVKKTGHARRDDGYVAMMVKADGTRVLVLEDKDFKVTKIEDPAPMRHRRGRFGPPPTSARDSAPEAPAAEGSSVQL